MSLRSNSRGYVPSRPAASILARSSSNGEAGNARKEALRDVRHVEEGVDMSKVGFLGLGAMGSRMAANLLKAGHTVTVWNRSPAAPEALVASGARKASSPKEAAEGPTLSSRW